MAGSHQLSDGLQGHVLDGFSQQAQGTERRAEAAGQVVACDGDEVIFTPLQMQNQDVLQLLAWVQLWGCRAVHKHLQVDVHTGTYAKTTWTSVMRTPRLIKTVLWSATIMTDGCYR